MRMDKWLWAARFFKTRSIAARACDLGRVEWNGALAKPARDVKVADTLQIRNEAGTFVVEVLVLSEMRGPAAVAQTLYRETDASKAARAALLEARKSMGPLDLLDSGKPSKKDRRDRDKFLGRGE